MSGNVTAGLFLLLAFLLLSALFSATETATSSIGKARLQTLQERHPRRRRSLRWLAEDVHGVLTVTLISGNLVNIAAGAVAAALSMRFLGGWGIVLAILTMTFLIVVFGEILPKSLAMSHSEKVLADALPLVRIAHILLSPLVWAVAGIMRLISYMTGIDLSPRHAFVTREEIEQMIAMGQESGALEEGERRMISGVIAFEETRAYEIMIPRTDMVAIPKEMSVAEAVTIFRENGHSRVPIYEGNLDRIVGILYVKEIIDALASGKTDIAVFDIRREPLFIPEVIRIAELFDLMKRKRVHMAIVVDEYGGTAGLVTLEDLLEEIVGEIQDEYDEEVPAIQQDGTGSYIVQGHVNLEDLSDGLSYVFHSEDADSVAGLVLSLSGSFPEEGQRLAYGPWNIDVLAVEDHRIRVLRFVRRDEQEGEDA
ncbi:hemolysin family protein [Aminiphilus sp.]|uniref:hemolysin family protein n=1 Tax=Aminiphilus sp. TaxID=1872488 RepID=UPI00262597CD|nr:hemolysin family protein [Aminiphilus sp.]